jgi:DNA-binding NarL/FixJ family response regulator
MKILIVEDHQIFSDGLKLFLAEMHEQPEILEAASSQDGFTIAAAHPDIDLVMLDISLPDMDGCEALRIFSDRFPTLPVIMLTASESRRHMNRCFDLGASGYIPKSSSTEVMRAAIRLVMAGGIYVPPSMGIPRTRTRAVRSQRSQEQTLASLTERQSEVLQQLMKGRSNKQIAHRLDVSEATVKVHVSAILRTLGLRSRVEAALLAQKEDLNPVGA